MNWYVVAQHQISGFSAEAFSAELSRLRVVTSSEDKHRLKKLILALVLGGMAGWGLSDLVEEITKKTDLDKNEAIEIVEEVAQESVPARIALQEAENQSESEAVDRDDDLSNSGTSGYDMDAFYNTLEDYEGSSDTIYNDDAGHPTIGIGHKIVDADEFARFQELSPISEEVMRELFERDVQHHIRRAERLVNDFSNLPTYLQAEILASIFRGGLSGSPRTLRLINSGEWREAAEEFLNNNEFRRRLRAGGDGVTRRMRNLQNAMLRYCE